MGLALAYFNEACMILSAVLMGFGWHAIRHHRVHRHRAIMLTAAGFATAFFLSYVAKTLLVGDTTFGGPKAWETSYQIFLQVHVILATLAGVAGIFTLVWALQGHFHRHRRIAPWTATGWFVAAATGLVVFLLLYVLYPPGPTQNIWKILSG